MDRAEWLSKMRKQTRSLYDHLAPAYWVTFGLYANATHIKFIEKLLEHLEAPGDLLDAGCGAGRYDGKLLEAGHRLTGIDQSGRMLDRAREIFSPEDFPQLRYLKMGLQEMDFHAEFDGTICIDAMEHVCPEDWPAVLAHFSEALRLGGVMYLSVEVPEGNEVSEAYEHSRAQGLPAIFGEVIYKVDTDFARDAAPDFLATFGAEADTSVYHYYPPQEQVRTWLSQAGITIVEEGFGDGYWHLLARNSVSPD